MKPKMYTVVFTSHCFSKIMALCRKEAIILAQAEQINAGHSYNVEFVKVEDL